MPRYPRLKLVTNQKITPRVIFRNVMSRPRSRRQMLAALRFCFEPAEKLLIAYAARLGDELRSIDSHMPLFEACITRAITAYRNVPPEPLADLQMRSARAILVAIIETSAEAFYWQVTGQNGLLWDPAKEDYLSFCASHTRTRILARALPPHEVMARARALMWQLANAVGAGKQILNILPELNVEQHRMAEQAS